MTSDLQRHWGIEVVEGRGGLSIYEHWRDGPRTFHGIMTDGFPGMFFTGYIQGALNSTTTEQFSRQGEHIAHVVSETLKRGAGVAESTREAVEGYCRRFSELEVDTSAFIAECTPSYYNNEGEKRPRWLLLRAWGRGWNDFQKMLSEWRSPGDLAGLRLID